MTLTMQEAKKYLSNVDKNCAFKFRRGHDVLSIEGLLDELVSMSDLDFSHHVTNDRNDFANWIENCITDKHLSELVRTSKDKAALIDIVKSRLFVLKLMTVLKEDFMDEKKEEKVEKMVETEIKNDEMLLAKPHHLPNHDISNLKSDRKVLSDIKSYISDMEQNEEKIVAELEAIEEDNKNLKKLFTKNFLHGFLLGLASGILVMIIALKVILVAS